MHRTSKRGRRNAQTSSTVARPEIECKCVYRRGRFLLFDGIHNCVNRWGSTWKKAPRVVSLCPKHSPPRVHFPRLPRSRRACSAVGPVYAPLPSYPYNCRRPRRRLLKRERLYRGRFNCRLCRPPRVWQPTGLPRSLGRVHTQQFPTSGPARAVTQPAHPPHAWKCHKRHSFLANNTHNMGGAVSLVFLVLLALSLSLRRPLRRISREQR